MKLHIEIDTSNAAFDNGFNVEVAQVCNQIVNIAHVMEHSPDTYKLRDSNGNTCGRVYVEEDEHEHAGE